MLTYKKTPNMVNVSAELQRKQKKPGRLVTSGIQNS